MGITDLRSSDRTDGRIGPHRRGGPSDVIDINFGCPVRKIAGRGAGSGMMRDVPLMVEMTRRIVEAVKVPVTVKTRLGWDEEHRNIEGR